MWLIRSFYTAIIRSFAHESATHYHYGKNAYTQLSVELLYWNVGTGKCVVGLVHAMKKYGKCGYSSTKF
jgi:hypothetical protein